jgi:hypothetical protein
LATPGVAQGLVGSHHTNGWQRSLHPSMKRRIVPIRSLTFVKVPRRMAWQSTGFSAPFGEISRLMTALAV